MKDLPMSIPKTIYNGDWECRKDILMAIEERLNLMINRHCKVFVVRLDISFPPGYPHDGKNTDISELIRRLKEWYTNNNVDCHYLCVREMNESELPHHHILIFLDGSKKENGWAVHSRASEIWKRIVGVNWARIHLCETHDKSHGIMIKRPSSQSDRLRLNEEQWAFETSRQSTLNWGSYLAKTWTKGNAPRSVREFQGSQL